MVALSPALLGGIPGGVEVLIILFVMFLLFGVPIALALLLGYRYVSNQTADRRVEELEREVERLKEQIETTEEET